MTPRLTIAPLALAAAGIALASVCACSGLSPRRNPELVEDVRAYNDGVRWEKFLMSAVHVPPAERDDFLAEREDLAEDLRIADYEIAGVEYEEGRYRARVDVRFTWHLDSRGIVHKTTTRQSWQRHGERWLMVEERHLRGEPMPGVPPREDPSAAKLPD